MQLEEIACSIIGRPKQGKPDLYLGPEGTQDSYLSSNAQGFGMFQEGIGAERKGAALEIW